MIYFGDLFISLIDENYSLLQVEKMTYIVKGEGLEAIGGLNMSAFNYKIAWQSLLDRYNLSRSLICYHVRELFEINQLSK